jgi:hypothetical protein
VPQELLFDQMRAVVIDDDRLNKGALVLNPEFVVSQSSVPKTSWPRGIGWLVLIWTASVMALALVAVPFRMLMSVAGLTR